MGEMTTTIGKLLQAALSKLRPGGRTKLQSKESLVCCRLDHQGILLHCVMASSLTYPVRLAYQLLDDLMSAVQPLDGITSAGEYALNTQLHPQMKELVQRYSKDARAAGIHPGA